MYALHCVLELVDIGLNEWVCNFSLFADDHSELETWKPNTVQTFNDSVYSRTRDKQARTPRQIIILSGPSKRPSGGAKTGVLRRH